MKRYYFILLVLTLLSCSKTDEFELPSTINPTSGEVAVQDFMWKAMNFWYFWQEEVPDLADDRFQNTTEGREAYTAFLASEENPADFFRNRLQFNEDRFSFFNADYRELTNSLAGISRSNGVQFGLVRLANGQNLFGYVRYILPNSDGATKAIERGDLFTGVDGQPLTDANFRDLLFGDNNTYTLDMAEFIDGEVTPNDKEVTLTKQEALAENPVFISKIFEINGESIGYLMYNKFTNEYDDDLYNAFEAFGTSGVDNLIVDLRYNPGGSVNTTRLLASMIYGTNTSDLFLRKRYNDKIQAQRSTSQLEVYFADRVGSRTINSLELPKLYVLTSGSSASASELLINSLEPYMDVIQIGDVTRGKNEFSTTLVDDRDNSYLYTPSRVDKINPNNQWAIQPLLGRNENADGFSDFTSGLVPDIQQREDLSNLGTLGDQNEPLLARAIQEIIGVAGKRNFTVKVPIKIMGSSQMMDPLHNKMTDDTHYNLE